MPGLTLDPVEFHWRANGMREGEILRRRREHYRVPVEAMADHGGDLTIAEIVAIENLHSVEPRDVTRYMAALRAAASGRGGL